MAKNSKIQLADGTVLLDISNDTVAANLMISGITAHGADGELVTGSIQNNGAISSTIDGLTSESCSIPAGYSTGGTVSLTSDIEQALITILGE